MYTSMSVSCGNECLIRCLNIILSVHRRSWGSAGSSPYCAGLQQHTDSLPGKPPHPAMPADLLLRIQRRWWVLRLTWCLHLQRLRLSHLLWAFCNLEDEIDVLESKKKKSYNLCKVSLITVTLIFLSKHFISVVCGTLICPGFISLQENMFWVSVPLPSSWYMDE